MAVAASLSDQIKDWFERTPRAQRAVKRLSADLDIVAAQVEKATSSLMEKVGPIIDPPARMPSSADADVGVDPVIPESESSTPPGIKKEGSSVDPTT